MVLKIHTRITIHLLSVVALLSGCTLATPRASIKEPGVPATSVIAATKRAQEQPGPSDQFAALESLRKVDPYPLYILELHGGDSRQSSRLEQPTTHNLLGTPSWACSLFSIRDDSGRSFFGRNFDWTYSPALLLFTNPPDGYASISIVDLAYLVDPLWITSLEESPLRVRAALLDAPLLPFDGMNEAGLAIGMAAVPSAEPPFDASRPTFDSLAIMRRVLDQTSDVDEAIDLIAGVNIDWGAGPALHYLIADRSGTSVLLEFVDGETRLLWKDGEFQAVTNFTQSLAREPANGICERYDRLLAWFAEKPGALSSNLVHEALSDVAQSSTQWSVVYEPGSTRVSIRMGSPSGDTHQFRFNPDGIFPVSE